MGRCVSSGTRDGSKKKKDARNEPRSVMLADPGQTIGWVYSSKCSSGRISSVGGCRRAVNGDFGIKDDGNSS